MSRKFVYVKKNGEPSKSVGLRTAMVVARARTLSVKTLRLSRDSGDPGPVLKRRDALARFRSNALHGGVGTREALLPVGPGHALFKMHEVAVAPPLVDISGNHNSDVYYSWIVATYPQYKPRYAGSYVCKDVAGTSTPSQHSYGNAVDFFFDTLDHQDEVAKAVVAHADELKVEHVISRSAIWTRGVGWHGYSGDYHSHLHVDFDPQFSGPCGVREP